MSPTHHQQTAPRAPGSLSGSPLPLYGEPGDACACGARLSSYNQYDACNRCLGRGVRASKRTRRAPASACSEAAATAAPESRRVSMEVLEMAEEERRKVRQRRELILAYLEGTEWRTTAWIAEHTGIPRGSMSALLTGLVQEGKLEVRGRSEGGGYRLRQDVAAIAAECDKEPEPEPVSQSEAAECSEDAPATSQAQAPASPPELPADEAPVPESPVAPPEGTAPAAGEDEWPHRPASLPPFAGLQAPAKFYVPPRDDEAAAIAECVDNLGQLAPAARRRVLEYLTCRFVVDEGGQA